MHASPGRVILVIAQREDSNDQDSTAHDLVQARAADRDVFAGTREEGLGELVQRGVHVENRIPVYSPGEGAGGKSSQELHDDVDGARAPREAPEHRQADGDDGVHVRTRDAAAEVDP